MDLMGLDEMAYKCKAVAMYAWHRTLDGCAVPLDNCIVSTDISPSVWWNPIHPGDGKSLASIDLSSPVTSSS